LIPFSVLLIKYYPDLGRQYSRWTWTPSFIGVSTDKNGLGVLSLVFGLAALWNLVEALRTETGFERMGRTLAHAVVIGMALFLFQMADSATSVGCVLLGGTVLFCLTLARIERRAIIHCIVVSTVVASVLAYLLLDAGTYMVQALGRDPTLTGRTELWAELLHMPINAWLGTGFGSFWLGDRAQYFWDKYWWRPNEAHNGYLEVYLDLGWIGVGLLVVLIVAGYRNIVQQYPQDPCLGRIRLTFFLTALVYCITEAAFKLMNPVWIAFLLAITALPLRTKGKEVNATSAIPARLTRKGPTSPTLTIRLPSRLPTVRAWDAVSRNVQDGSTSRTWGPASGQSRVPPHRRG
jgi:O-antigen ligase